MVATVIAAPPKPLDGPHPAAPFKAANRPASPCDVPRLHGSDHEDDDVADTLIEDDLSAAPALSPGAAPLSTASFAARHRLFHHADNGQSDEHEHSDSDGHHDHHAWYGPVHHRTYGTAPDLPYGAALHHPRPRPSSPPHGSATAKAPMDLDHRGDDAINKANDLDLDLSHDDDDDDDDDAEAHQTASDGDLSIDEDASSPSSTSSPPSSRSRLRDETPPELTHLGLVDQAMLGEMAHVHADADADADAASGTAGAAGAAGAATRGVLPAPLTHRPSMTVALPLPVSDADGGSGAAEGETDAALGGRAPRRAALLPGAIARTISSVSSVSRMSLRVAQVGLDAVFDGLRFSTGATLGASRRFLVNAICTARRTHQMAHASGWASSAAAWSSPSSSPSSLLSYASYASALGWPLSRAPAATALPASHGAPTAGTPGTGGPRPAAPGALAAAATATTATSVSDAAREHHAFEMALDRYTSSAVFLLHSFFGLSEMLAMTAFYMANSVTHLSLTAAEEAVQLFDGLFGDTETSKALASFISLIIDELQKDDEFTGGGRQSYLTTLSQTTKAMLAYACLQYATRRQRQAALKLVPVFSIQPGRKRGTIHLPRPHQSTSASATASASAPTAATAASSLPRPPSRTSSHHGSSRHRLHRHPTPVDARDWPRRPPSTSLWSQFIPDTSPAKYTKEFTDLFARQFEASALMRRMSSPDVGSAPHGAGAGAANSGAAGGLSASLRGLPFPPASDAALVQTLAPLFQQGMARGAARTPPGPASPGARSGLKAASRACALRDGAAAAPAMTAHRAHSFHGAPTAAPRAAVTEPPVVPPRPAPNGLPRLAPLTSSVSPPSPLAPATVLPPPSSSPSPAPSASAMAPPHFSKRSLVALLTDLDRFSRFSIATYGSHFIKILGPQEQPRLLNGAPMRTPTPTSLGAAMPSLTLTPHRPQTPTATVAPVPSRSLARTPPVHAASGTADEPRRDVASSAAAAAAPPPVPPMSPMAGESAAAYHSNHTYFSRYVSIPAEHIVTSTFNTIREARTPMCDPPVYYLAVDTHTRSVVLSLRGTLGFADIVTDLTAQYEPFTSRDGVRGHVHGGMLHSARKIADDVRHILIATLDEHPGFRLVICGHSLGGGTASVLALMWARRHHNPGESAAAAADLDDLEPTVSSVHASALPSSSSARRRRPPPRMDPNDAVFSLDPDQGFPPHRQVVCYAYGTPAVLSVRLSRAARGLVTAVIFRDDIFATVSLGLFRDFRRVVVNLTREPGLAERIVGKVLGLGMLGVEREPDDAVWFWALAKTLRADMASEKLFPPGSVYWINPPVAARHEPAMGPVPVPPPSTSKKGDPPSMPPAPAPAPRRHMAEGLRMDRADNVQVAFATMNFSKTMIVDHSPWVYEKALNKLRAAVIAADTAHA